MSHCGLGHDDPNQGVGRSTRRRRSDRRQLRYRFRGRRPFRGGRGRPGQWAERPIDNGGQRPLNVVAEPRMAPGEQHAICAPSRWGRCCGWGKARGRRRRLAPPPAHSSALTPHCLWAEGLIRPGRPSDISVRIRRGVQPDRANLDGSAVSTASLQSSRCPGSSRRVPCRKGARGPRLLGSRDIASAPLSSRTTRRPAPPVPDGLPA